LFLTCVHRRSPLFPYTTLFRSWSGVSWNPKYRPGSPSSAPVARNARPSTVLPAPGEPATSVTDADGTPPPSIASRPAIPNRIGRSEEHTSELQSRENLVCRLLL